MKLESLEKLKNKSKKRVGRGYSSGRGKTAGRGAKGQKKRGKVKLFFEGGQLPLQRRLPQRRGLNNLPNTKSITITTSQLNQLPAKTLVNENSLREAGFFSMSVKKPKLKIVAKGNLSKSLKISVPVTKKAESIIKKAGGSLANEDPT